MARTGVAAPRGIPGIAFRDAAPEDAAELVDYLAAVGGETDCLSFGADGLGLTVGQGARR